MPRQKVRGAPGEQAIRWWTPHRHRRSPERGALRCV